MIDFKALKADYIPGQFMVAEGEWRNIPEMPDTWLRLASEDLSSSPVTADRDK